MTEISGELAAIATAFLFAAGSTLFTLASRRVGSPRINRMRLLFASGASMLILWATRGAPLPVGVSLSSWGWLALSGILGLSLGDTFLFRGFVLIGTARSMLIFSLAPAIAATFGWLFLAETLTRAEILGIAMTLAGIMWVVSTPSHKSEAPVDRRAYGIGLACAFGGAVGQALGLVTAKVALEDGVPPQDANCIRLVVAAASVWLVTFFTGSAVDAVKGLAADRRATTYTLLGSMTGPVIGVWLSLVAIELSSLGVASTLMSLTPLILLPIGRLVFQEPITFRALAGTTFALAGVAVLLGATG